jgi:hypothetical protein
VRREDLRKVRGIRIFKSRANRETARACIGVHRRLQHGPDRRFAGPFQPGKVGAGQGRTVRRSVWSATSRCGARRSCVPPGGGRSFGSAAAGAAGRRSAGSFRLPAVAASRFRSPTRQMSSALFVGQVFNLPMQPCTHAHFSFAQSTSTGTSDRAESPVSVPGLVIPWSWPENARPQQRQPRA